MEASGNLPEERSGAVSLGADAPVPPIAAPNCHFPGSDIRNQSLRGFGAHQPSHSNASLGRVVLRAAAGKVGKRPLRVRRKSSTHAISTDVASFRPKVHELTGMITEQPLTGREQALAEPLLNTQSISTERGTLLSSTFFPGTCPVWNFQTDYEALPGGALFVQGAGSGSLSTDYWPRMFLPDGAILKSTPDDLRNR